MQQQPNRQQPQQNKQIFFIIAVYLMFTMFSHLSSDPIAFNKNVINIIKNPDDKNPAIKTLMGIFSVQNYMGSWKNLNKNSQHILNNNNGKIKMRYQKFQNSKNFDYQFQFQLNNGYYIDNGDIVLRFIVNSQMLQAVRNHTTIQIKLKESLVNQSVNFITANYHQQYLLRSIEEKVVFFNKFGLKLQYMQKRFNQINIKFILQSQQFSTQIIIEKQQSMILSTIVFAVLLFVISYMQFTAAMDMLRGMFQGRQSAGSYSMLTVLFATLWDAVICLIAFIQAFGNQQSLILFIMPAFLLCLLFTNLELRLLLMIFQANSENRSIRQIVCKFNLITYGSLILMYPIMKLTNLSPIFFIIISLILLPQIYENARRGQRPNLENAYYTKFLTFRYLLILYMKCFPWNIFQLQPNYLLSITCIGLLTFQYFLLWIQKQYGPKKVMPKFLLPPVFNYSCEIYMNVEEGTEPIQCAICLSSLGNDPEPGSVSLNVPFRIMQGPCGHKFHGACLAQWMQIKMQCPQCRGKLPPFQ